jgi:hypothetical protein
MPPAGKNKSSSYHVAVLTYPSQSPYLPPDVPANPVEHKTTDFSASSLKLAFAGQDLVISTVAGSDYDLQVRIINAVVEAGVKRYMPDEFGHDSLNKRIQERMPRVAARAKTIGYLRNLSSSRGTEFEWAAIACGYVLDTALISGNFGIDMLWQSATIHGTGDERFAATSLRRAGTAVASVIRHWDEIKNQYLYSAGTVTSAREVLACLDIISGSECTVDYSDVHDCLREGKKRIERGYPDSGMFLLEKSILCDESLKATEAFEKDSANKLLQLKSETVDGIIRTAHHEFNHRGNPSCGCT